MKHLLPIAIEYQEFLKQLPPDIAYDARYREKRRELIRNKFNSNDRLSYQEEESR